MDSLVEVLSKLNLITAFVVVGIVMWFSYWLSDVLSNGKFHGSAIAIILGLVLAYVGGLVTGGEKGLADIAIFAGIVPESEIALIAAGTRSPSEYLVSPPEIIISNPDYLPGSGEVEFSWGSESGQIFDVEYSTNLRTWTPLQSNISGGEGSTTYSGLPPALKGYYRIRLR